MGKQKKDKGGDDRAAALLAKGRAAFQAGSLEDALDNFTKGLSEKPSSEPKAALLAARLEALIGLGRHASALRDALAVEELDPGNPETAYRQGICEDALGLHRRAVASLSKACGEAAPKKAWQKALREAQRHEREQTAGEYAWPELYKSETSGSDSVPPVSAAASFCHCLEIKLVPGRGRALVLTADVAEGTLLFVSRAFALAPESELQALVVKKLATCPQVEYDRFCCLCDGSNADVAVPAELNLDGRHEDFDPGENAAARTVDKSRVERILKLNTYARDTLNDYGAAETNNVCGIWFIPTFVNHSCRPNVQRTFVGDLMVCRAARALRAGTELCDTYVTPLQPLHIRRERLKEDCGFECRCERCTLEEAVLPSEISRPLLLQLDKVVEEIDPGNLQRAAEAFDQLATLVEKKVTDAIVACKSKLESDARLKKACAELLGGREGSSSTALHRLLCGSFMPVFKGAAFSRKQLGEPGACARLYGRCLELLEEVSASSAYHAHWAAECALQAYEAWRAGHSGKKGSVDDEIKNAVNAARRWNSNCYGGAAFEPLMEKHGWPEDLLKIAEEARSAVLPREDAATPAAATDAGISWDYSLTESEGCLVLSLFLPEGVEPSDVDLELGTRQVVVSCHDGKLAPLTVELTKAVDTMTAPPAKYKKKGGRRLVLELPIE